MIDNVQNPPTQNFESRSAGFTKVVDVSNEDSHNIEYSLYIANNLYPSRKLRNQQLAERKRNEIKERITLMLLFPLSGVEQPNQTTPHKESPVQPERALAFCIIQKHTLSQASIHFYTKFLFYLILYSPIQFPA
jgi:hypothetical protein